MAGADLRTFSRSTRAQEHKLSAKVEDRCARAVLLLLPPPLPTTSGRVAAASHRWHTGPGARCEGPGCLHRADWLKPREGGRVHLGPLLLLLLLRLLSLYVCFYLTSDTARIALKPTSRVSRLPSRPSPVVQLQQRHSAVVAPVVPQPLRPEWFAVCGRCVFVKTVARLRWWWWWGRWATATRGQSGAATRPQTELVVQSESLEKRPSPLAQARWALKSPWQQILTSMFSITGWAHDSHHWCLFFVVCPKTTRAQENRKLTTCQKTSPPLPIIYI